MPQFSQLPSNQNNKDPFEEYNKPINVNASPDERLEDSHTSSQLLAKVNNFKILEEKEQNETKILEEERAKQEREAYEAREAALGFKEGLQFDISKITIGMIVRYFVSDSIKEIAFRAGITELFKNNNLPFKLVITRVGSSQMGNQASAVQVIRKD